MVMGSDNYFWWRDGGCTEEVNRLTRENKKLREQLKVAVHQGMEGARAGYEETIQRQRQAIYGLISQLGQFVLIFSQEDFPDWETIDTLRGQSAQSIREIMTMLGISESTLVTLLTGGKDV
jgi:hypothetical protein